MADFNKVILVGNLTRDPELKYTQGGTAVCQLGLAVNRKYRVNNEQKEEICFVDITVWGKQGENCKQYLAKGRPALVEGRLQYRTWEGSDGQKRSKLDVVAESVTFLPRAQQQGGRTENGGKSAGMDSNEPPFPSGDDIPF